LARPSGPAIKEAKIDEEEQRGEKRFYVKKRELPFIVSAYKVPNIKEEDGFAIEVLGYPLGWQKFKAASKACL
jgi:hypothetical protein